MREGKVTLDEALVAVGSYAVDRRFGQRGLRRWNWKTLTAACLRRSVVDLFSVVSFPVFCGFVRWVLVRLISNAGAFLYDNAIVVHLAVLLFLFA